MQCQRIKLQLTVYCYATIMDMKNSKNYVILTFLIIPNY